MAPEQSYAQRDTIRAANADNILEIKERLQRRATWELRISFRARGVAITSFTSSHKKLI